MYCQSMVMCVGVCVGGGGSLLTSIATSRQNYSSFNLRLKNVQTYGKFLFSFFISKVKFEQKFNYLMNCVFNIPECKRCVRHVTQILIIRWRKQVGIVIIKKRFKRPLIQVVNWFTKPLHNELYGCGRVRTPIMKKGGGQIAIYTFLT